jgi:hypothetical protein
VIDASQASSTLAMLFTTAELEDLEKRSLELAKQALEFRTPACGSVRGATMNRLPSLLGLCIEIGPTETRP